MIIDDFVSANMPRANARDFLDKHLNRSLKQIRDDFLERNQAVEVEDRIVSPDVRLEGETDDEFYERRERDIKALVRSGQISSAKSGFDL